MKEENNIVCSIYRQKEKKDGHSLITVSINLYISISCKIIFYHTFSFHVVVFVFIVIIYSAFLSWLDIKYRAICMSFFPISLVFVSQRSQKLSLRMKVQERCRVNVVKLFLQFPTFIFHSKNYCRTKINYSKMKICMETETKH